MRKKLRAVKEDLYEALRILAYTQTLQTSSGTEWRRNRYHLIINDRKSPLDLHLHRDISIPTSPFHKAVHNAQDVKAELHKILDAYRKRRLAKSEH